MFAMEDTEAGAIHFIALLRFYQTYQDRHSSGLDDSLANLIWWIVDVSLFSVGEIAIHRTDTDRFYSSVRWHELWCHISEIRRTQLPSCLISVKKGFFQRMTIYVLEISYISRRYSAGTEGYFDYLNLAESIKKWERDVLGEEKNEKSYDELTWVVKAYVGAVLIHVTKLRLLKACCLHEEIKAIVDERIQSISRWALLSNRTINYRETIHYKILGLYPVVIMLCAVNKIEDFEDIVGSMKSLRGLAARNTALRIDMLVRSVQQRKCDPKASCMAIMDGACNGIHDGLDFLIRQNGIFGDLHISST